jgi:hypothetical protein
LCYGKIGIEINFVIDPTWVWTTLYRLLVS